MYCCKIKANPTLSPKLCPVVVLSHDPKLWCGNFFLQACYDPFIWETNWVSLSRFHAQKLQLFCSTIYVYMYVIYTCNALLLSIWPKVDSKLALMYMYMLC